MAICPKCKSVISDGAVKCPSCGARVSKGDSFSERFEAILDTKNETANMEKSDIEKNKGMAAAAYLGFLVLIPAICGKNSKFVRFHTNQGLVLFVCEIIYAVVQLILTALLNVIFPIYKMTGSRGYVYGALSLVLDIPWILITILAVYGLIKALQGTARDLPVIGKFRILKK